MKSAIHQSTIHHSVGDELKGANGLYKLIDNRAAHHIQRKLADLSNESDQVRRLNTLESWSNAPGHENNGLQLHQSEVGTRLAETVSGDIIQSQAKLIPGLSGFTGIPRNNLFPIQRMKGLRVDEEAFVHTNLGPKRAVILALLDGGESYRIKVTDHYDQIYEVSHFIVDTDHTHLPSDTSLAHELDQDADYEDSIKAKILAELDALIAAKKKKIDILEKLRSGEQDGVTDEEQAILAADEKAITGKTAAMMLEATARKSHPRYDPFIVMGEVGFKVFLEDLVGAVDSHVKGITRLKTLHLILFDGGHYTPVKINISRGRLNIFSVDASGTPVNFAKFDAFAKTRFALRQNVRFYSDGDVQKDTYHCESFSMNDLQTMANMSTKELLAGIPDMRLPVLNEHDHTQDEYYQEIHDIDSRFMANAQSNTEIQKHKSGRSADPSLSGVTNFIDRHSFKFLKGNDKTKNRSIDYSRYHYLIEARKLVATLSLQEIENVLDVRIYRYRDLREVLLKDDNL